MNTPALHDTSQLKMTYREGDIIRHPAGTIYRCVDRHWELIQEST